MNSSKTPVIYAVLLILCGAGWLLNVLQLAPDVDWIWTLGLAASGLLVLFCRGVNKASFVVGLFLTTCAVFSVLRQTGRLSADLEVPSLLIVSGVLILISYYSPLPHPGWLVEGSLRGGSNDPG